MDSEPTAHGYDVLPVSNPQVAAAGDVEEAVVVTTPRLPAVHSARRTGQTLRRYSVRSCGIAVNRVGPGNHPSAERIADFVGAPLLGEVPADDAVPLATDAGKPVVVHAAESEAAKAFRDVATAFVATARRK